LKLISLKCNSYGEKENATDVYDIKQALFVGGLIKKGSTITIKTKINIIEENLYNEPLSVSVEF
jgi:hypothetical protein